LAGLAVSKFPHTDLTAMYKRILRVLDKFPKDYAYRTETEKIVQNRLKIVREVGHTEATRYFCYDIVSVIALNKKCKSTYLECRVLQTANVKSIEDKIGCGQIEELILQAKNEMRLAEKMIEWKPWEKLMQEAPSNQWTWPPHK
jgi:NADH dehydrogenase (ubiquinone) 1 alpha subcomplex subunit 5